MFEVRPITEQEGRDVLGWRYPGRLSIYDPSVLPSADGGYLAVRHGDELVGFGCVGAEARVPGLDAARDVLDVGWGLRPDLVGRGHGTALVASVVEHLDAQVAAPVQRAAIHDWNAPSLHVATAAGFVPAGTHRADERRFQLLERRVGGEGQPRARRTVTTLPITRASTSWVSSMGS